MASLLRVAVACFLTIALTPAAFGQTVQEREAQAIADNPTLSKVDSVRFLGTLVNCLAGLHGRQVRYDAVPETDFVGRMTQLRLMASEADVAARTIEPFIKPGNDNIQKAAETANTVFLIYKSVFEKNVALYEDLVRIFTIPHKLTDREESVIAEGNITASKIGAQFAEASDLLRLAATLAFASAIVPAPGDHIALDMSKSEKLGFINRLHRDFDGLDKQSTLAGPDVAAFSLMTSFDKDWLLAR